MNNSLEISFEIRKKFLNFFKKKNHLELPSSPLIPKDDPSLLFTNSGMVQFKNLFTGQVKPTTENIITIQKCLRAGGKHNDLENVGLTPRHHTFFEMLGNFSFGGYFKSEAIEFAWNFLVDELDIPKNKLFITYHKNDNESQKIWKKISGFSDDKIISIDNNDNFWAMGELGPCGYCSEIFFDNGGTLTGGLPGTVNQDGERYVEIWNLVFMEFLKTEKELKTLSTKCVDTGMGLERITAVLSDKSNNYETDLFRFVFSEIEKIFNIKLNKNNLIQFRIISDHIKAICMLMSEGILPSNEGRGYVLRRIIRRAIIQVNKIKPGEMLLYKIVDKVVEKYSKIYFELDKALNFIQENLKNEEEKFLETLDTGLSLLKKEISELKNNNFPSDVAFKLYDTFGFPIDVTKNILVEKNINLDLEKYDQIVKDSKIKQKSTWVGNKVNQSDAVFLNLRNKLKPTNFLGYKKSSITSRLGCIIHDGKLKKKISLKEDDIILIFDDTSFYAESGGQVGDKGKVVNMKGDYVCDVTDTKKVDGEIFLHLIKSSSQSIQISVGDKFELLIDEERRNKIKKNHSATHLLHESLRKTLGDHVSQKGSLVNDKKLRFDFSYSRPVTNDQIEKIEELVNKTIQSNLLKDEKYLPVKDALKNGAIALFGEKYPDKVRVISFLTKDKENIINSSELCGGIHVDSTGQIGSFKILSDTSVSSGTRRIEAVTGNEAHKYVSGKIKLLDDLKYILKATDVNIKDKVINLQSDLNRLRKESGLKKVAYSKENIIELKKVLLYFDLIEINPRELKNISDLIKKSFPSGIIILMTEKNKKLSIVTSVTKDLVENYNALEVLKKLTSYLGGKGGGGREDLAQGGAPHSKSLKEIKNFLIDLI
ncbi:MAG: alanine--tRNA ligase [Alphaproteobacteria bacterium]